MIEYINTKEGIEWVTMDQISKDFKSKNTPPEGALLPAKQGEIQGNPEVKLQTQLAHDKKSENLAEPW